MLSCVLLRLLKSPLAGFVAAIMLKRPVPELVLALANIFEGGAVVVVVAIVSAGLLDPKSPPDDGCDRLPKRFDGAAVVEVSWPALDPIFEFPKRLAACC